MTSSLQSRRLVLEETLTARGRSHTLSLARFQLHRHLSRAIAEHAAGVCLDVGSGRSPYLELLARRCSRVTSVDIEDRSGRVDLLADIQRMPEVADASFDTVLCTQVLEHVPRPWDALAELGRVLRPGGKLILSLPHLSAIHEAPHDYYRYTRYGLAALCEGAGLEVLELRPTGGLLAFLGHGMSYLVMSTLGAIPVLGRVVWALNYLLGVRLLYPVDRLVGLRGYYPSDHVAVAGKAVR